MTVSMRHYVYQKKPLYFIIYGNNVKAAEGLFRDKHARKHSYTYEL